MSSHAHANEWDRFIIYCKDFWVAAEYAAENGWWLHCWHWQTDDDAPDHPEVIDLMADPDPSPG